MSEIVLDAGAGQVSTEIGRRGIAASARLHVVVELMDQHDALPMADMLQAGGAFDWLAHERGLYRDPDLTKPAPPRVG